MKKVLFIPIVALLVGCKPEKIPATGLVTYFFNENFGQKPDLGAEITFIKKDNLSEDVRSKLWDLSTKWTYGKTSYNHTSNQTYELKAKYDFLNGKITEKEYTKIYIAIKNKEQLQRDSLIAELYSISARSKDLTIKSVADANGTFTANLDPGKYFVYVVYANREGVEMDVNVDATEAKNLKYEFKDTDL